MSDLVLREEPYDGPVATALIAAVQQEYVDRYGGPDESPVEPGEFAPPRGRFLVGYVEHGGEPVPVAIGGLRSVDTETVEIKRMYVVPEHRRRGRSREVLARLEDEARSMGARRVLLETGTKQPEAMRLYETSGYARVEGFGHYCGNDLSVSYGKSL